MDKNNPFSMDLDKLNINNLAVKTDPNMVLDINTDSHIEITPVDGQVKYENGKLMAYHQGEWVNIGLPTNKNGYSEIETFIEGLSASQLQDIYKRKEDLLILIESKLLGKV